MEAKLKHLEFIQSVIARMSTSSFLFKGWAITIAGALAAFAAVDSKWGLLAIAIISTVLFWGLDGYYLWLERCFIKLHETVAATPEPEIDFSMAIDKDCAFCRWIGTCGRPHLVAFYGLILATEIIGIFVIKGK